MRPQARGPQRLNYIKGRFKQNRGPSLQVSGATGVGAAPQAQAQPPGYVDQGPYSAAYENKVGVLNRDRDNANAQLQQREFATQQAYGFAPGFQDNPFSRAALLQRSYDQAKRTTLGSGAARGQLYSDALTRHQGIDNFNYLQQYDTAQREYLGDMSEIGASRMDVANSYADQVAQAGLDRIYDAMEQDLDPTAVGAKKKKRKKR